LSLNVTSSDPEQPGTILAIDDDGIVVRCGEDALRLLELQRAGGKRLPAAAFLNGYSLSAGDQFQPVRN